MRAALGAASRELFLVTAWEGAMTALAGGAIGAAGGVALVRVLDAQLFGVGSEEAWWILPLVAGSVVLAMALATVPSALRGASVDPLTALRVDR